MHRHWKAGIAWIAIVILPLAASTAGAAGEGWKKMAPQALAQMMAQGKAPVLINTMGLIECLDHSIAGSVCMAGEELEKRIAELPKDKSRMLVLYCESDTSQKSCEAADVAAGHGYSAVHVLEGGLPAWKRAGYDTVAQERIPRRAIPSVKPQVLQKRLVQKQNLLLLDIRSESAFQKDHIEGAMNLPMYQLHRRWRELPLDRPLVLVDNRGFRSPLAASYLAIKGYGVEPLFGGMTAWKAMLAKDRKNSARK